MPELSELRGQINRIDTELRPLLEQRMDCAGQIADAKMQTAAQTGEKPVIFAGAREAEILAAVDAKEHTESIRRLMQEIMGISRRHQYRRMLQNGALSDAFGAYQPGTPCRLILKPGKLNDALRIVCRYAVDVEQADQKQIILSCADAEEMCVLRTQLIAEGCVQA